MRVLPGRLFYYLAWCALAAPGQTRLERIDNAAAHAEDLAVLSRHESLTSLGCDVASVRPALEIDLKYHTGYTASVPLKELAGDEREIRTLVRVTPLSGDSSHAAIFSGSIAVPRIEPGAPGDIDLTGEYVVGPGEYRVDWLLRDGERVCSAHWKVEAKTSRGIERLPLGIPANTAAAAPPDPFQKSEREPRSSGRTLSVKVLVNFSAANPSQSVLSGQDVAAITAIMRAIEREPQFGRFEIVAFSMDQQRVLYRQPPMSHIDFPAMGKAVEGLQQGTVDIAQVTDAASGPRFLTRLFAQEFRPGAPPVDAVIVVSPTVSLDRGLPVKFIATESHIECPVFYLNYNPDPTGNPWGGALAEAIKKAYHGLQYTIARPRDLGSALEAMEMRLKR